jgi:hypothetical protein
MVPRDDPTRNYPSTTEAALGCAMKNLLSVDMVIDTDRFDQTVLASIKYHAPYVKWDLNTVIGDLHSNVVAGTRPPQVLSEESTREITRLDPFIQDWRFYNFANKVAMARERNMFACMMETTNKTELLLMADYDIPPHNAKCSDTCDADVITEDEWLMIQNADCSAPPTPVAAAAASRTR